MSSKRTENRASVLVCIVLVGFLGWSRSQAALTDTVSRQLAAIRASKAYQVESYFLSLRRQIELLSEDKMVVEAMTGFDQAFDQLNKESIAVEWDHAIEGYYRNDFFPRLIPNVSGEPTLPNYVPESQASRYLQYHYIAANQQPVDQKYLLHDATDSSQYSKLHAQYHPFFHNMVETFGYPDLFLINFDNLEIVYSVDKEVDYATSLINGPYARSGLAEVVKAVHRHPNKGAVQVVDFQPYTPLHEAPTAFFAVPIYDDLKVVGILALQLPTNEINKIMTWEFNWKENGLGDSGESYLVGSDFLKIGEPSKGLYLIQSGRVVLSLQDRNDQNKEIYHLSEGNFFGEIVLLRDESSPVSVTATDDLTVLIISRLSG